MPGTGAWLPAVLSLLGVLAFLALTGSLQSVRWEDARTASLFAAFRINHPSLFFIWVSRNAAVLGVIVVATSGAVAFRRDATASEVCRIFVLLTVGLLVVEGLKLLIFRDRPGGVSFHPVASNAFPSGHVANAAFCVAAALALVGGRKERDPFRAALACCGPMFVVTVAIARLYTGLHWLTDVTASVLLGLSFGGMLFSRRRLQRALAGGLVFLVLPALYLSAACGVRLTVTSPTTAPASARLEWRRSVWRKSRAPAHARYSSAPDTPTARRRFDFSRRRAVGHRVEWRASRGRGRRPARPSSRGSRRTRRSSAGP